MKIVSNEKSEQESCHVSSVSRRFPTLHLFTLSNVYLQTPMLSSFPSNRRMITEIHQGTILAFLSRPIQEDGIVRAWKQQNRGRGEGELSARG